MSRDDCAFLQVDVGQHHAIGRYKPAIKHLRHVLLRHLIPTVEGYTSFAHRLSPATDLHRSHGLYRKGTRALVASHAWIYLLCYLCLFVANSCWARYEP